MAPRLADGKEPTSAKAIRYPDNTKQKQHVVLYARQHGNCHNETKFNIPQRTSSSTWLKNFHDNGFEKSIAKQ